MIDELIKNEMKAESSEKIREGEYDLLTLKQARMILGIGQNKMYSLINSGQIPYVTGISGRKIRRGALYDYILAHEKRG